MKKNILILLMALVPLLLMAQASGGQIKRNRSNSSKQSVEVSSHKKHSFKSKIISTVDILCTVDGVDFKMVFVEGGSFKMGGTLEQGKYVKEDERPIHEVTISSFYIGETEVTQKLWQAVMGKNPSSFKGDKLPVECVSWLDCQKFINKLNKITGYVFCLPTEAEWEFAARGGKNERQTMYSGGNNIDSVAWSWDEVYNYNHKTHIVKTKKPNELGIYDMSGNVCEWCQDWYGEYSESPSQNPQGPSNGTYRIHRGGSWAHHNNNDWRVSARDSQTPDFYNDCHGLRLALHK